MSIMRVKVKLLDRNNVERVAYIYFTNDENYNIENVRSFIEGNEELLFGTKPLSVEEDVTFEDEAAVREHIEASTGPAWDPAVSALQIFPPLTIGPPT